MQTAFRCLADSRSLYSCSKFLPRSQGNQLNLLLDAFRFHKLTSNLVFITCYLKAIPTAYSVSSQNRACSFTDGRWQSVDGNDEVCNTCEPSKQAVAEPEPIQPFRITLAPPVRQPYLAQKPGPANFFRARPVQSLEPFKSFMQSRQYAYSGLLKRGTDSSHVALKQLSPFITDWSKIATLGPLFPTPKQETTTQSTGFPQSGPAEVFSASVAEEPELLFNSTKMSPVTDELKFKTDQETGSFSPLEKGLLFLNASPLLSSDEGSGFEQ